MRSLTELPARGQHRTLRSILTASALALASCVSQVELVSPTLAPGTRAVLFVLERGEAHQVIGVSIDDGGRAEWPALAISRTESYTLYALAYGCTLADLGFAEGINTVTEATASFTGKSLVAPAGLARAQVSGLAVGAWEPLAAELPASLQRVHVGVAEDVCAHLPTPVPLALDHPIDLEDLAAFNSILGVAMDGSHALIGPRTGTVSAQRMFYAVGADGTMTSSPLLLGTPDLAAFHDEDDQLWILGSLGEVWRGTVARGPAPFSNVAAPPSRRVLAGAIDGVGGRSPDVFALLSDGVVRHFDGTRWTTVHYPAPPVWDRACTLSPLECMRLVDLVRTGPGTATWTLARAAGDHGEQRLYSYDGTRVTDETDQVQGEVTALATSPSLGRVLGTSHGEVLWTRDGRLAAIPGSEQLPKQRAVTRITPLGAGHVVAYADGRVFVSVLGANADDVTFCELATESAERVEVAVAVGSDGLVVASQFVPVNQGETLVLRGFTVSGLKTRRTPASCSAP